MVHKLNMKSNYVSSFEEDVKARYLSGVYNFKMMNTFVLFSFFLDLKISNIKKVVALHKKQLTL